MNGADGKIILLVEDNPDDVDLTLLAFQQSRIQNEVVVARDGVEAIELLLGDDRNAGRGRARTPAVVLLDLKLPRMDGLEVLQRMRADARTATIPVVVLTSSREEQDIIASYRLGCNSYVRKPVNFEQFAAATRQLGLYWLLLNEAPRI
jgi:two-component system, response regulator